MHRGFLSIDVLANCSWQYLERSVGRLLLSEGFTGVRLLGQSGDEGADILAHRNEKRWLVQVKRRRAASIGVEVLDETIRAAHVYRADVPVVATNLGFTDQARTHQSLLMAAGTPLQLWDRTTLSKKWERLPAQPPTTRQPRPYQESAIASIVSASLQDKHRAALVVMATGLGKTFVAAESYRRMRLAHPGMRALVLAHTNDLVYQLERAFWPCLDKSEITGVWNGYETPDPDATLTFACIDSVASKLQVAGKLDLPFELVIVDECHHAGSAEYRAVLAAIRSETPDGPFLIGMTATPWRPDGTSIHALFGEPVSCVDIVQGLKMGWLSNVDYRMHVDNINWQELNRAHHLTPRGLNRTIFIQEWDDAVVQKLKETWYEIPRARAIVFCGNIDHAITMRDRVNGSGFARAEALYAGSPGAPRLSHAQRSKILADFHDGYAGVLCAVDLLNEGIDLPDVNIVVFQRVTHSRRIFVQQLGRGLRIASGKDKVIVLDFVSDVRRFAAGLDLQNKLQEGPQYVSIGSNVRFMNLGGEDKEAESFLREWLEDVAAIESAGEDDHVLKFPPPLSDRL
ncbi:MAG: DEAD/DEAH box helicase family protein [Bryobacteraceae bacterium]|nr:DEAD/DEAH box helicase family protein [Solibacteraceae bacterium]MCO5352549.1 DEAD/DEAH box helicase family protein [Bryobacteraceae bacterium]